MNLINIAFSGAQAAKYQLNVTAMNTANIHTPGYTRQRAELSALGGSMGAGMSVGNGVEVTSLRRVADQYLVGQIWASESSSNYYGMSQQYLDGLEGVLGRDTTSIGDGLDTFFAGLNEATTQPDSSALRKQIISGANALATRFNNINNFINNQKSTIASQRTTTVASINTITDSIAQYNKQITELEAGGGNSNTLRDERDQLVRELSKLTDVKVNESANGSYNISLKDGHPLVNGSKAASLEIETLADGSQQLGLKFAGSKFNVDMSTGGQLGALYDYEKNTLNKMQESITSMAKEMADAFNDQLANGYDLDDNPGKPLFTFDPTNPKGMLQVTDIKPEELALSGKPGEPGNGDNLAELIDLKNRPLNIANFGSTSLSSASASIISEIGITSSQNQVEGRAAATVLFDAETQRNNLSAVNLDEEAVNLMTYTQAYQSNLKVMAAGDQLFSDLLSLF